MALALMTQSSRAKIRLAALEKLWWKHVTADIRTFATSSADFTCVYLLKQKHIGERPPITEGVLASTAVYGSDFFKIFEKQKKIRKRQRGLPPLCLCSGTVFILQNTSH